MRIILCRLPPCIQGASSTFLSQYFLLFFPLPFLSLPAKFDNGKPASALTCTLSKFADQQRKKKRRVLVRLRSKRCYSTDGNTYRQAHCACTAHPALHIQYTEHTDRNTYQQPTIALCVHCFSFSEHLLCCWSLPSPPPYTLLLRFSSGWHHCVYCRRRKHRASTTKESTAAATARSRHGTTSACTTKLQGPSRCTTQASRNPPLATESLLIRDLSMR